ncbi:DUF523 domain-containing protein [Franconibacter pulveris]|nr:DUF523 domain-containing protein [Franconibacter pulveris]
MMNTTMLISACLMGFRVRYHGLDKPVVLNTRSR